MTDSKLAAQDDVTVVTGARLARAHVYSVSNTSFKVRASPRISGGTGFNRYNLADEGITWVRGFHERGAPELAPLLAYVTMR